MPYFGQTGRHNEDLPARTLYATTPHPIALLNRTTPRRPFSGAGVAVPRAQFRAVLLMRCAILLRLGAVLWRLRVLGLNGVLRLCVSRLCVLHALLGYPITSLPG